MALDRPVRADGTADDTPTVAAPLASGSVLNGGQSVHKFTPPTFGMD